VLDDVLHDMVDYINDMSYTAPGCHTWGGPFLPTPKVATWGHQAGNRHFDENQMKSIIIIITS
jgi:hypothetical protein